MNVNPNFSFNRAVSALNEGHLENIHKRLSELDLSERVSLFKENKSGLEAIGIELIQRSETLDMLYRFYQNPDQAMYEMIYERYLNETTQQQLDTLLALSPEDADYIHQSVVSLYRSNNLEYTGQFASAYRELLESGADLELRESFARGVNEVSRTVRMENQFTGYFSIVSQLSEDHDSLQNFFHFVDHMNQHAHGILNTMAHTLSEIGTEHADKLIEVALGFGNRSRSVEDREMFKVAMDRVRSMDDEHIDDFLGGLIQISNPMKSGEHVRLADEYIHTYDILKTHAAEHIGDFLSTFSSLNISHPSTYLTLFTSAALAEHNPSALSSYFSQIENAQSSHDYYLQNTHYEGRSITLFPNTTVSQSTHSLTHGSRTLTSTHSENISILNNPFLETSDERTATVRATISYSALLVEFDAGAIASAVNLIGDISQEAFETTLKEALTEYSDEIVDSLSSTALGFFDTGVLDDAIAYTLNLISGNQMEHVQGSFDASGSTIQSATTLLRSLLIAGTSTGVSITGELVDSHGERIGNEIIIAEVSAYNLIFGGFASESGQQVFEFDVPLSGEGITDFDLLIHVRAHASTEANLTDPTSFFSFAAARGSATVESVFVSYGAESQYQYLQTPLNLEQENPTPESAYARPLDQRIYELQQAIDQLASRAGVSDSGRINISDNPLIQQAKLYAHPFKTAASDYIFDELERYAERNTKGDILLQAAHRAVSHWNVSQL